MSTIVILVLIVTVVIFYKWFTQKYGRGSKYDVAIGNIEGPGRFEFEIVGESHYQRALQRIAGARSEDGKQHPCTAILELDDGNPHDNMAVRVDIEGETVGYLDRQMARQYRRALERQGVKGSRLRAKAMIVGGWDRGGGDRGHYGVKLDLPLEG